MTGVSMIGEVKDSVKTFYEWLSFRKVRRFFYWILFIYVLLSGLSSCTMKWMKMTAIKEYVANLDPIQVREKINFTRANWINTCVNNGAAGVLGGATMGAEAIEACKAAGFDLYPEQDWRQVAKDNRNEFYEKMLWDTRP